MNKKFSDKDILKLLSSLKNAENNYPSEMVESRRDAYMKQAAAMAVLWKATGNGSNSNGGGGASASSATAGGSSSLAVFLEAALLVTIALEAGIAAYIYRDKIAGLITTLISPATQVVSVPPVDSSSTPAGIPVTGVETGTEAPTLSPTVTVTLTETPSPVPSITAGSPVLNDQGDANDENLQIESTPPPNENPGNHYGNTPKPERTKDSDGNSSDNNNNDKQKDKKD